MLSILRWFLFLLVLAAVVVAQPSGANRIAERCDQVVLVVTPNWNQPKGRLHRFDRVDKGWREAGQPIPVILGGSGLAWGMGEHKSPSTGPQKREGDQRAPAGIFRIGDFWKRPHIAAPSQWEAQTILPDTFGVDDPRSRYYNRIVRRSQIEKPDWKSREKMDIPDYDRVLVVEHNTAKPVKGRGSCIFVHRWETSDTPTAGCTAMAESDLVTLIEWLDPAREPRLVQLPQGLADRWGAAGWIPQSTAR